MSLKIRQWVFFIFLGAMAFLAMYVLPDIIHEHPEPSVKVDPVVAPDPNTPEYSLKGMQAFETQDGKKDWELKALTAAGSKNEGTLEVGDVEVKFFTDNVLSFTVTGDKGFVRGKDISVQGHAVTRTPNGYVFTSDVMIYTASNRQLVSPGEVHLRGPKDSNLDGVKLRGDRMVSHVNDRRMEIFDNIRASKPLADGGTVNIRSEKAEFSAKNKIATFSGQMKMDYLEYVVEAPEVVFFSSNKNKLTRIEVRGGVKMKDPEHTAKSSVAVIDVATKRIALRGSPVVTHLGDEFEGDEIILLDGGKQVKIERN